MNQDAGLQERLDTLAVRIGHGVSLDDPYGRLIAYSAHDTAADPVRTAAILSRQVAPEVQDWQNRHGIAEATGPVSIPANPDLGMTARLCVPIRAGRSLLGYLWAIEAGAPLEADAIDLLISFGQELSRSMSPRPPARDLDDLTRRVLSSEPDPDAVAALIAAVPGLVDHRVLACVLVPTTTGRDAISTLTDSTFAKLDVELRRILQRKLDHIGSFVGTTHALLLLRKQDTSSSVTELNDFGADVVTIGVSKAATVDVDSLRDAHHQALAAAELASLDPALPRLCHWQDLGPYRTILGSASVAESVLAPLEQAGPTAAAFLRTLEIYLDSGGDARRTAEILHLHRTTLYYRLGRISELLGADLGDGLVRLDLHLALKSRRAGRRTLSR